jgi:hypothetical protein
MGQGAPEARDRGALAIDALVRILDGVRPSSRAARTFPRSACSRVDLLTMFRSIQRPQPVEMV